MIFLKFNKQKIVYIIESDYKLCYTVRVSLKLKKIIYIKNRLYIGSRVVGRRVKLQDSLSCLEFTCTN